jgi:hypothetical protein
LVVPFLEEGWSWLVMVAASVGTVPRIMSLLPFLRFVCVCIIGGGMVRSRRGRELLGEKRSQPNLLRL